MEITLTVTWLGGNVHIIYKRFEHHQTSEVR